MGANAELLRLMGPELGLLLPGLDERSRRLVLGTVARAAGDGGPGAVARLTGASWQTVADGAAELASGQVAPQGRIRRPGAGRKKLAEADPGLVPALLGLVADSVRGVPQSPLAWTTKSVKKLAGELTAAGHACSPQTAWRLLHEQGFSTQANARVAGGRRHPDRDAQFGYIAAQAKEHLAAGQPVISVDAKKKEQVGQYAQAGREWRPGGDPVAARSHDFPDEQNGHAIPYGVYDVGANTGFVNVGTGHNTAAFAVESVRRWWNLIGKDAYPHAGRLLVTCDAGGANDWRSRGWKAGLAALARQAGLEITCCHFPPGTSKWNKIEHRLFSQISLGWRGRPLTSYEVIINTIGAVTTRTGLTVTAVLDDNDYPTAAKVSDAEMDDLEDRALTRHDFHGEWNYTLHHAPPPPAAGPPPPPPPPPARPRRPRPDPRRPGPPRADRHDPRRFRRPGRPPRTARRRRPRAAPAPSPRPPPPQARPPPRPRQPPPRRRAGGHHRARPPRPAHPRTGLPARLLRRHHQPRHQNHPRAPAPARHHHHPRPGHPAHPRQLLQPRRRRRHHHHSPATHRIHTLFWNTHHAWVWVRDHEIGLRAMASPRGKGSGHALVGGDGEELGVVVGQGDLREQGHGLLELARVERGAVLLADQAELLADEPLHQIPGHLLALGQRHVVVQPLPDLGPGDLRGGRVLHQVEDRHGAGAGQPVGQVLQAHADVVAQPGLGDPAGGLGHGQQVSGADLDVVAELAELVGPVAEHAVEHLLADRHQVGVGHPGAVESVGRLARLVVADLGQRRGVDLRIASARDERGHAAHRVRAACVAGLDQQLGVGAHERGGHRHRVALGEDEVAATGAELLDDAEQVVPAARVQPGAMVPQLVENLVHFERRRDRLDQDGRADRAAGNAQPVLGQVEGVVPEPRLLVALVLGQVEVRALALVELAPGAVREVQREVEQAAGHPLAVDQHVLLVQVPAARPDHDRGQLVVGPELVGLPVGADEVDPAVQRVLEVELAGDHVVPERGVRVLEVGEPDPGARVQRVDRHLLVGRPGDLHPAVDQARRGGRHPPGPVVPDPAGRRQEVQRRAVDELLLAGRPGGEELRAARAELPVQRCDQAEGLVGEDLVVPVTGRAGDLDALGLGHAWLLAGR